MKIANLNFDSGLFLAPMAGVTDHPFRSVCVSCGAECVTTEMISAKAIRYGDVKTWRLGKIYDDERPAAVQLFGSDPETLAFAAAECEKRLSPSYIDINMGCPMPKIFNNGEGSALMKDPSLCGRIVGAVKRAVGVPVTVKLRAGVDENSINAVRVACECEQNGASAVFVHGRTRSQVYSGHSDPSVIAAVKKNVSVPVIANGDITDAASALRLLELTGADGVMVARGAMGNPWIFAEIKEALCGGICTPPTDGERLALILGQINAHVAEKGERALPELRKHLSWYIHAREGAAAARAEINRATTTERLSEILSGIFRE